MRFTPIDTASHNQSRPHRHHSSRGRTPQPPPTPTRATAAAAGDPRFPPITFGQIWAGRPLTVPPTSWINPAPMPPTPHGSGPRPTVSRTGYREPLTRGALHGLLLSDVAGQLSRSRAPAVPSEFLSFQLVRLRYSYPNSNELFSLHNTLRLSHNYAQSLEIRENCGAGRPARF